MAELDGRLARARQQIVKLQDERRAGRGELDAVAALVPVCAELLQFCAERLAELARRA